MRPSRKGPSGRSCWRRKCEQVRRAAQEKVKEADLEVVRVRTLAKKEAEEVAKELEGQLEDVKREAACREKQLEDKLQRAKEKGKGRDRAGGEARKETPASKREAGQEGQGAPGRKGSEG